MPNQDYSADRAAFDDIVARQLGDLEVGVPDDMKIEVDRHEAAAIDRLLSGLEQTNGMCGGFESVRARLLRKLHIRDSDE